MKERHQRSTHRSTEIYPEYHPGISAQPMIPESAQAEFWPTTSPRRVGLASCARRGAEGSFLCSPSSRFSGRGGGVGSLPRAWRASWARSASAPEGFFARVPLFVALQKRSFFVGVSAAADTPFLT